MSGLLRVGRWLAARAENILALMLGAMFALFILQIVFRYALRMQSAGPTSSAQFCGYGSCCRNDLRLRSRDDVRLDIIYSAVSSRTRRVMTVITAIALVALFGLALTGHH